MRILLTFGYLQNPASIAGFSRFILKENIPVVGFTVSVIPTRRESFGLRFDEIRFR